MFQRSMARHVVLAVSLAWMSGVVACNGADAGSKSSASEGRTGALAPGREGEAVPAGRPLEDDSSETLLPGEHVREIDWREARSFPAIDRELVSESLAEFYANAPVPVLLPPDGEVLETVEPTLGRHWYAAHLQVDGRDITIEGDRVVRRADRLLDERESGGAASDGFTTTQTEGVMTVSFTAFGAAYVVDVECEEVNKRGTCTNESFAVELANRLARLGGRR